MEVDTSVEQPSIYLPFLVAQVPHPSAVKTIAVMREDEGRDVRRW